MPTYSGGGGGLITGCVVIDLSTEPTVGGNRDRRLLDQLASAPDGCRVVVNVGRRSYVSQDAARWLHEHDHRLFIEIQGARAAAVARFVQAARTGEWGLA